MKRGKDFVGVGIGAVIFNKEGKVFLSKRGEKAQNERGKWEFPGGALEFGDSFEDTIKREVYEEFGIRITPCVMLTPFNHLIPEEHQHWVALSYLCVIVEGTPTICEPEKSTAIGWYSLDSIKTMSLTLPSIGRLDEIQQRYQEITAYL